MPVGPAPIEAATTRPGASKRPLQPVASFRRMVTSGLAPRPADRAAGGVIPTRAFRYCEAVTTASAFGWYAFPPVAFSLVFDGTGVLWSHDGEQTWQALGKAHLPGYLDEFNAAAPDHLRDYVQPFVGTFPEPGVVQVWTGLAVRMRPGWSLLLRAPANMPRQGHYELFEGIVEADRWFGPLFTNVRITKTDVPIRFNPHLPFVQMQPLPRDLYLGADARSFECVDGVAAFDDHDWADYERTVVRPTGAKMEPLGMDATRVRRRRKGEEGRS